MFRLFTPLRYQLSPSARLLLPSSRLALLLPSWRLAECSLLRYQRSPSAGLPLFASPPTTPAATCEVSPRRSASWRCCRCCRRCRCFRGRCSPHDRHLSPSAARRRPSPSTPYRPSAPHHAHRPSAPRHAEGRRRQAVNNTAVAPRKREGPHEQRMRFVGNSRDWLVEHIGRDCSMCESLEP